MPAAVLFSPLRLALLTALSALSVCGQSTATEFYQAQGKHSLNAIFGIPTPLPPTLAREQSVISVSAMYANQFAGGSDRQESLLIDGERAELRLSWHQAQRHCLNWGWELPLIAHGEGYFDRGIETWHEWFSLPNANREEFEPNSLLIQYNHTDGTQLQMNSSSAALGDAHLQWILPSNCAAAVSLPAGLTPRLGLKLPTGSTDLLTGSGAADIYLDITTNELSTATGGWAAKWAARASLGLIKLGNTELVNNQRSWAAFGSVVFGWQYNTKLELLAQLDWHTPLFVSELRELGSTAAQLTFGFRYQLARDSAVEFAIQEDVNPDTAPDIGLYLNYRFSRW